MRADGEAVRLVTQTLDEIERRIARRQAERLLAGQEEGFPTRIAVGPLGDGGNLDALDPQFTENCPGGLELAAPAINQNEIGPRRKRLGGRALVLGRRAGRDSGALVLDQAGKAPAQHFAHHSVIVAGRQLLGLDVEGAIMAFHKALRACDHHAADRIRAHNVRIVIDLDPAQLPLDPEGGGECFQHFLLRGGLGKLAAHRLARIIGRMFHEFAALAALRHHDLDLAPHTR